MPHIIVNGVRRHLRPNPPPRRPPHHRLVGALAPGEAPPVPPPKASARQAALPVFDQGQVNDCTSNSTANLLMHLDAMAGKPVTILSRLYIYYATRVWIESQSPTDDNGAENSDAIKAVTLYGAPLEDEWPYSHAVSDTPSTDVSTSAKKRLAMVEWECATLRAIKLSISQGFPVICAIPVAKSFEASPGVVFPVPSDSDPVAGYHSILLDEYDDGDGMVGLRNSWGTGVGLGGFFRVPYAMFGPDMDTLLGAGTWASDAWTVRSETSP